MRPSGEVEFGHRVGVSTTTNSQLETLLTRVAAHDALHGCVGLQRRAVHPDGLPESSFLSTAILSTNCKTSSNTSCGRRLAAYPFRLRANVNVMYLDLEDASKPYNGQQIDRDDALSALLGSMHGRQPFLCEFCAENGFKITVGIGHECGTVQFGRRDGLPPYMMAVAEWHGDEKGFVEFLAGGTPSPIPRRFCLPMDRVRTIIDDFLKCGGMSSTVAWREV
jgi:hypothetical protein